MLGDDALPGLKETFVSEVIIPTLNGAASTQTAVNPIPNATSS